MYSTARVLVGGASLGIAAFAGCSSVESVDPAGGTSSTSSATSASSSATTSTSDTTGSTSSGNPAMCAGLGVDNFPGDCGACLEDKCCAELEAWAGEGDLTLELNNCRAITCGVDCVPAAPALVPDAECAAPPGPQATGACVTLGGFIECNPVTNELCDTAAGEACVNTTSGFVCFALSFDANICDPCNAGNGPYCKAGSTCVSNLATCAKFCCDDSDCGPGRCFKEAADGALVFGFAPNVGVCVSQ